LSPASTTSQVTGRLTEARLHLDHALQINSFVLPGQPPFVESELDGRNSALRFMHHCLLLLGFPDQAAVMANEAASLKPGNLYLRGLEGVRLLRICAFARDVSKVAALGP